MSDRTDELREKVKRLTPFEMAHEAGEWIPLAVAVELQRERDEARQQIAEAKAEANEYRLNMQAETMRADGMSQRADTAEKDGETDRKQLAEKLAGAEVECNHHRQRADIAERERDSDFKTLTQVVADRDQLAAEIVEAEKGKALAEAKTGMVQVQLQNLISDPTLPEHLQANAQKIVGSVLRQKQRADRLAVELAALREACMPVCGHNGTGGEYRKCAICYHVTDSGAMERHATNCFLSQPQPTGKVLVDAGELERLRLLEGRIERVGNLLALDEENAVTFLLSQMDLGDTVTDLRKEVERLREENERLQERFRLGAEIIKGQATTSEEQS